jgi:hypothetical protein
MHERVVRDVVPEHRAVSEARRVIYRWIDRKGSDAPLGYCRGADEG